MLKGEIVEFEREYSRLVLDARAMQRKLIRARWAHDNERITDLVGQLAKLGPSLRYAHTYWARHGRWEHYYRVRGGSIHTTLTCRAINPETVLEPLCALAGRPRESVAGLCRHCCWS